jgi:hypothetical protein
MNALARILIIGAVSVAAATAAAHGTLRAPAVSSAATSVAQPVAAPSAPPATTARDLTLRLLDAHGRHAGAAQGERASLLAEVVSLARARHDELVALAGYDAEEFLRVELPAAKRAEFPPQAQAFFEQTADESGDLEVLHVDNVTPGTDVYLYFLNTAKGRLSLHFADKAPTLQTGAKVRVHGSKIDDAMVLADGSALVVTKAMAVLGGTLGVQKTLTILVNFSDAPTQPFTPAYAQGVMFTATGSTSNYDYENSYQQTSMTGAVAGWYTIAATSTTCDYNAIATQAKSAASAAGYVLSNYNRFVFAFPSNTCTWWGLGTVGGNPSQAWIHSKWGFSLPVVGHEMGHNLGLYHSHSLDCGSASISASGCTASEYGDAFDMMGSNSSTPHYNAFQKERLGWLNAGVSPPLTTVAAIPGSTTYTIAPLENVRDGVSRALKIPRGSSCVATNEWFYVEARQAKGFDAFLAGNANVQGGVLIHKVTEGNGDSSYLLDMTAATAAWSDAALVAGQTFTDPVSGVSIVPLSVGSSGATVNVTFPPASCLRANPAVTLTPTATVWTSAGATTTYSVSVTNKDGCGCPASTFDVGATVPAGWSASGARTASVSPGGVTATSVLVTTAASAAANFYTVGVTGANSAASTYAATANGTIAVATALTVAVATDKASYTLTTKRNGTTSVTITTQVLSSGAAVSGAPVSFRVTAPGGGITNLAANTSSTGLATVTLGLKSRTSTKGTYGVSSTATMGSMSGTAASTFVVN